MRSATNSTLKSFRIAVVDDCRKDDRDITSALASNIPDNSKDKEGEEGEDATKADTDHGKTNCQDQPTNLEII